MTISSSYSCPLSCSIIMTSNPFENEREHE